MSYRKSLPLDLLRGLHARPLPSSGDMTDAHASLGMDSPQAMDGDVPALTPTRIYMMTWED